MTGPDCITVVEADSRAVWIERESVDNVEVDVPMTLNFNCSYTDRQYTQQAFSTSLQVNKSFYTGHNNNNNNNNNNT